MCPTKRDLSYSTLYHNFLKLFSFNDTCTHFVPKFLTVFDSLSQCLTVSHNFFSIVSIIQQFYSLVLHFLTIFLNCMAVLFTSTTEFLQFLYCTTVYSFIYKFSQFLVTKSCFSHCAYALYTRLELVSSPRCQGRSGPTSLFLSVFIIWGSSRYNAMGIFTALIHSYHLIG